MTTPQTAPCAWTIDTGCCEDEWAAYDPAVQANATAWATQILWALTGRQFGLCEITVRPCGSSCRFPGGWMTFPVTGDGGNMAAAGGWVPFVDASGAWRNCGCPGMCSCSARCEVLLPGPVSSVTEVHVDGALVPADAYRVDNNQILVRTDGECWPQCQDFDHSDLVDVDTFHVVYERGTAVPLAGQIAAGILACDFAKTCTTGCVLPGNLQSLNRQGVDVQMVDPSTILGDGLTGISQVDQWIRAVNPYSLKGRVQTYSPDLAMPRMRTS